MSYSHSVFSLLQYYSAQPLVCFFHFSLCPDSSSVSRILIYHIKTSWLKVLMTVADGIGSLGSAGHMNWWWGWVLALIQDSVPWGISSALALDLEPIERPRVPIFTHSACSSAGDRLCCSCPWFPSGVWCHSVWWPAEKEFPGVWNHLLQIIKTFCEYLLCSKYQIGCFVKFINFPEINEELSEVDAINMCILKTRSLRLQKAK